MKIRWLSIFVLAAMGMASVVIGGCVQEEAAPSATPLPTIRVSMLIYASEDDAQWFRDFEILKGTNAYELTEQATEGELEATYYASLFSHWVESIMGTPNEAPNYWLIFQWNGSAEQWEPLPVGADLFSLKDGHALAWAYTDTSLDPQPVPSVTP